MSAPHALRIRPGLISVFIAGLIAAGELAAAPDAAVTGKPAGGRHPNILIIMADQQRAEMTKHWGFPVDTMPTLDKLAERGVAFPGAYAASPLCAPTRVSLLTGRWPRAHRVRENSGTQHAYFDKDLYDVVRDMGYTTALIGKNHSHIKKDKLDFSRFYGHHGGYKGPDAPKSYHEFDEWLMRLNHGVSHVPTPFPPEVELPHRIVSDTIEFMKGMGDKPFALWLNFPEPHNPYQVPKPYYDMFPPSEVPDRAAGPEVLQMKGFKWEWLFALENHVYPNYDDLWRRTKSNYMGMLRLIDDQLARLVEYMEQSHIFENTIIVYTADHGDFVTDYGLMRKGVELPEALIRIPMVWCGWGIQGGNGRSNHPALVSTADIMPTLCEAIGATTPVGVQGRSLWPLLQGRDYPVDEFRSVFAEVGFGGLHYDATDKLDFNKAKIPGGLPGVNPTFDELNSYTQSGYMKMARMGDWKLSFDMMGNGQLYNLKNDPHELHDLYNDPGAAQARTRMLAELLAWTIRLEDNLPTARYEPKWAERNWYSPHRNPQPAKPQGKSSP